MPASGVASPATAASVASSYTSMPAATLGLGLGVMLLLLAIHVVASGGTGRILASVQDRVAVTPATTLSHGLRHLVAGLFHSTWGHIAFNLGLFALAYPVASQAASAPKLLLFAYLAAPACVLLLHLVLVRPMAGAGNAYALSAMDRPLVGFSVMAYTIAGVATRHVAASRPLAGAALAALVAAFELVVGLTGRTGPYIFVYHLAGFTAGSLAGYPLLARSAPADT